MSLVHDTRSLRERIDLGEVRMAYRAVADLLIPERDLHVVDRDDFSTLLRVLNAVHDLLADGRE